MDDFVDIYRPISGYPTIVAVFHKTLTSDRDSSTNNHAWGRDKYKSKISSQQEFSIFFILHTKADRDGSGVRVKKSTVHFPFQDTARAAKRCRMKS